MPRRAALGVLSALITLQTTPDHLSDLALSHSSPSSHHPKSLILAPKSPSHISLRVPMEPSCPAGTLHALQLTPATSQIAPERLSDLAPSHSPSPLSHKSHLAHSLRVPMEPSSPAGPLHALQLTPATSQIAPERLSDLAPSHSSSPLSHRSISPSHPAHSPRG